MHLLRSSARRRLLYRWLTHLLRLRLSLLAHLLWCGARRSLRSRLTHLLLRLRRNHSRLGRRAVLRRRPPLNALRRLW
jgi:hypothetical protein